MKQLILITTLQTLIILRLSSIRLNSKLLGNTAAQPNPNHTNKILKNATIAMPFKYLSIFGDDSKCH